MSVRNAGSSPPLPFDFDEPIGLQNPVLTRSSVGTTFGPQYDLRYAHTGRRTEDIALVQSADAPGSAAEPIRVVEVWVQDESRIDS